MAKTNHKVSQKAIGNNIKTLMPTAQEARANLLAIFAQATPEEREQGFDWYAVAHDIAATIHDDVRCGAGIIAALSPSTAWEDNVVGATHVADTGTEWDQQSHLFNTRALACRAGGNPSDILGGRKVRSFWRNVSEPWRTGPVTIDRHAVSILAGYQFSEGNRYLARRGVYTWCAGVYRSVGRELGIPPQCVQAVAWLVWRRMSNRDAGQLFFDLEF